MERPPKKIITIKALMTDLEEKIREVQKDAAEIKRLIRDTPTEEM